MSTWLTPTTAVTGAVSVAFWNTEVRDHLNWLKSALDLLTNNTASDVGDTANLYIKRAASGSLVLQGAVTADANPRFQLTAAGRMLWGNGTDAPDTALERTGIGNLKLSVVGAVGAQTLELDHILVSDVGFIDVTERSAAPGAPASNTFRLYAIDDGSGHTRAAIKFPNGTIVNLATSS